MGRVRGGFASISLIASLLAACTGSTNPSSPSSSASVIPTVVMTQVEPWYPGALVGPSLLAEGPLVLEAGCYYVGTKSERYLLLWPEGAYVAIGQPAPQEIVSAAGKLIARVGGPYRFSGGPVSRSRAKEILNARGLRACDGQLWQVTAARPQQ